MDTIGPRKIRIRTLLHGDKGAARTVVIGATHIDKDGGGTPQNKGKASGNYWVQLHGPFVICSLFVVVNCIVLFVSFIENCVHAK